LRGMKTGFTLRIGDEQAVTQVLRKRYSWHVGLRPLTCRTEDPDLQGDRKATSFPAQ
jgi:hypothetical protein